MEILEKNLLLQSGVVIEATDYQDCKNVLDRDIRMPLTSIGFNNDASLYILVASFTSAQVYNRIAIVGHNLKEFYITYLIPGIGFTVMSLLPESGTILASWISNSLTSQYLMFDDITSTQFRLCMQKTMVADDLKSVGYVALSKVSLAMSQKPGYAGYYLTQKDRSISHELSNGGHRYQTVAQKMGAQINLEYVTATMRSSFYDLYFNRQEMIFVPNPPTTTASTWDRQIFPCVWANGFDFETYSDNCATAYYSGSIALQEISK